MFATAVTVPSDVTPSGLPIVSIRHSAALTPRGTVAVMVLHLERELDALDGPDRAFVIGMLRELLEGAGA
jgi:hypothetical protein